MDLNQKLEERDIYKRYLLMKFEQEDWHAVWDVAVELYRVENEIRVMRQVAASELAAPRVASDQ